MFLMYLCFIRILHLQPMTDELKTNWEKVLQQYPFLVTISFEWSKRFVVFAWLKESMFRLRWCCAVARIRNVLAASSTPYPVFTFTSSYCLIGWILNQSRFFGVMSRLMIWISPPVRSIGITQLGYLKLTNPWAQFTDYNIRPLWIYCIPRFCIRLVLLQVVFTLAGGNMQSSQ